MRERTEVDDISIFLVLFHVFPSAGVIVGLMFLAIGAYLKWMAPDSLFGVAPLFALASWVLAIAALTAAGIGYFKRLTRRGVRPRSTQHEFDGEENHLRGSSPTPPACPRCGVQMVRRVAGRGPNAGRSFWGCTNFPDCRQTIDI